MRCNFSTLVLVLIAASANPPRPAVAEEHVAARTPIDSTLAIISDRIDSVAAVSKRLGDTLDSLRNEVEERVTTSAFRDLNGAVDYLSGQYYEVRTGLHRADSLYNEIRDLPEDVSTMVVRSDDLEQRILTITNLRLAEGEAKYNHDVNLLRAHQKLMNVMRETLNALENAIKQEAYASAVRQFTSPASDSLGFSILTGTKRALYSLKTALKKKKVKKLGGVKFSRIDQFVTQAMKSPLASAVGISAISAGLSSVTSFVTSLAAREKKVLPSDLQIFSDTLKPYMEYYARLDAANKQLRDDLNTIEAQSRSVRVSMNTWIFERLHKTKLIMQLPSNLDSIVTNPETTNKLLSSRGLYSADSLDLK